MARVKFQDRLQRSFLGYAAWIVAVIVALYLGGFLLNAYTVVVRGCRQGSREAETFLSAQLESYTGGMEMLAKQPELLAAAGGRQESRTDANRLLYDFANRQTLRSYFLLLSPEAKIVCSNFSLSNQKIMEESAFLGRVLSRAEKGQVLGSVFTAPVNSDQDCAYSLCLRLEEGGYLMFNLRQQSFRENFSGMEFLLTDSYDNVIYTTLKLPEDPQDKLPSGKFTLDPSKIGVADIEGSRYYVSGVTVEPQRLRLYTLTCLDIHLQMLGYGLAVFAGLLAVLWFIIRAMTRAFSQQNALELSELKTAVEQLEQAQGPLELPEQCSEETQELYTHFRKLIRDNNELIDLRRRMEIKHLESQFNPHFVFNVMETIRFQMEQDPKEASRMLRSFASLMRYSIHYGDTKVPLETDVEYVNDYLLLQKARYNNCLHYEFHIPEELLDCRVPKLLLQPVIENSIKHGYQAGKILNISIRAEECGDDLRFTVEDDGRGMEPERLEAVMKCLDREPEEVLAEHVGLYNVQKVVRLTYGPAYGLEIHSCPERGTAVTLKIPYEMEE